MIARAARLDPLIAYVTSIIVLGAVCGVAIVLDGVGEFHLVLTPEIGLFALCALIGDFLPLKVFTRGAEGEITPSLKVKLRVVKEKWADKVAYLFDEDRGSGE